MIEKFGSIIVTLVIALVPSQLGKDLGALLQLIMVAVQEAQDKLGSGKGNEKREMAINHVFEEINKPGGIDLPTFISGDIGRKFVGLLIDGLVALGKGKSGN